jgi:hypothetical protein
MAQCLVKQRNNFNFRSILKDSDYPTNLRLRKFNRETLIKTKFFLLSLNKTVVVKNGVNRFYFWWLLMLHNSAHVLFFIFYATNKFCMEYADSSHLLTLVPLSRIFLPWRWRRYVTPKRRFTQDLHGAIFQKTVFFIVTAVKTSNLT